MTPEDETPEDAAQDISQEEHDSNPDTDEDEKNHRFDPPEAANVEPT